MNFFRQLSRISARMVHSIALPNGHKMPIIGLGTWQSPPDDVKCAVWTALNVGYRHIDTAFSYQNESAIGEILSRWFEEGRGLREDLFIVTKLPMFGNRPQDVQKYLDWSLRRLKLRYVDLYLIHAPFGLMPDRCGEKPAIGNRGQIAIDCQTDLVAIWEILEQQVDAQKTRAIGVSNFNIEQLERVACQARILPANIQVELHARLQQTELRKYCKRFGIPVTAYASLGTPGSKDTLGKKYGMSADKFPDLLNNPLVMDLAAKCNRTAAQILLRHQVQNGIVVIPKSINTERIIHNFKIFDFELTADEMDRLDALDCGSEGRIMDFRMFKGIDSHPEYPFKEKASFT